MQPNTMPAPPAGEDESVPAPDFDAQKIAHRALTETTDHRAKAQARIDQSTAEQAAAIREAFRVGIAPAEILRVTGLSRTRIYEIRDGR